MAGGTTTTDLNGLFKEVYAADLINLIPDESLLTKAIKFQGRDFLLGLNYNQPVIVRSEQGFTYSRPDNGAFDIALPSSMQTRNASVGAYQIIENSGISYEAVSRSNNANSFKEATALVMQDAMESFGRRIELALLYGRSTTGLGQMATAKNVGGAATFTITNAGVGYTNGAYTNVPLVSTSGAGSGAQANVTVAGGVITVVTLTPGQAGTGYAVGDTFTFAATNLGGGTPTTPFVGTVATVTSTVPATTGISFAAGQWAAGMWTPLEGAGLDAYGTNGSALNTVGPLTISSINIGAKSILVQGAAGDLTALNAGGAGGILRFYSKGSNGADEAVGLERIMSNTGTLFGIDASVYNLWQANVYNVGGPLTLAAVQSGLAVAAQRGLSEDVNLYVNPKTWVQLSSEEVAFRMFDSSYNTKKGTNGFEALEFHTQTGKVSVYSHKYVKEGEAFALPTDRAVRIGSTEVSFNIPGTDNGTVFIQNPTTAGFTFRLYSAQSLLVEKPASCVKFTGITVT